MTNIHYFTYIIQCSDKTYYTGVTNDLKKRVKAHNGELRNGAKYTKTRRPVTLMYYEEFKTKSDALKEEYILRHRTRQEKEVLIKGFTDKLTLL